MKINSRFCQFVSLSGVLMFGYGHTFAQHVNIQHSTNVANPALYVRDVVSKEVGSQTEAHVNQLKDYLNANIKPWLSTPIVVNAIKAQNKQHAHITMTEIDRLDAGWIERTDKKLIDSKMNNPLSTFLTEKKSAANGVIFEIFVMDNKGLNVGQTDLTQDYMQGDEAKWQRTFLAGPDAVFVDRIKPDNGVNVSQASITIKDPVTGKPIGAVTIGIATDKLK